MRTGFDGSRIGLSESGRIWLDQPINMPTGGLGSAQQMINSIARTFGISTREALMAVCGVLSVVIGPNLLIRGPFGESIPVSMQLLVASSGRTNLYGAFDALGQCAVNLFARALGRRRRANPGSEGDAEAEVWRERKAQHFPIGEVLDAELSRNLIACDGECAFGSLSHTIALKEFCAMSGREARFLAAFIRSGWSGHMVSAVEGHPVFPTVSLLWGASDHDIGDAVRNGILHQLPGLLVARSVFNEDEIMIPRPWPDGLKHEWLKLIYDSFVSRMSKLPRHIDPESALVIIFEDNAEDEVAAVGSLHKRYTQGRGFSAELLRNALLQVAKIAALLTVIQSLPQIDQVTVRFALEIYRGLLRDTLATIEEAMEEGPDSSSARKQKILDKLSILGPLSLKDLANTYPKLDAESLLPLISEMMGDGAVIGEDGKFRTGLQVAP